MFPEKVLAYQGFRVPVAFRLRGKPPEQKGKQTDLPLVGLRPSEPQILILEVFHMTMQIRNEGIYNSLVR